MTARAPAYRGSVPKGYEVHPVVDADWQVLSPDAHKRCRWIVAGVACPNEAVAKLDRWWAYCPDHMYGRWVDGGLVLQWRLREVTR